MESSQNHLIHNFSLQSDYSLHAFSQQQYICTIKSLTHLTEGDDIHNTHTNAHHGKNLYIQGEIATTFVQGRTLRCMCACLYLCVCGCNYCSTCVAVRLPM